MLPDGNAMAFRKKRRDEPPLVTSRIWEIDFLRGLSIILMLFYHAGFDLAELCGIRTILGVRLNIDGFILKTLVIVFAGLFVLLCGMSSTLTRNNIRRAWKLLGIALLVTCASYIFNPAEAIHFGILHCLGTCILIYGWTLEKAKPWLSAAAAAVVFGLSAAIPLLLKNTPIHTDWLLPFGIISDTYGSLDYFPLLPWLGVFFTGAALGKWLYADRQSRIRKIIPESVINRAGRHSLLIYVVHQPIFLAILYLAGWLK
jgi:uncharacterized membrane protein